MVNDLIEAAALHADRLHQGQLEVDEGDLCPAVDVYVLRLIAKSNVEEM